LLSIFVLDMPLVCVVTAAVGFALPLLWLRVMARRQLEAIEYGLAEALDRLAASRGPARGKQGLRVPSASASRVCRQRQARP
jgi:hypothetical protein